MKFLSFVMCLLLTVSSMAKIPHPQKNTYVNDFAGVLKPSQIKALNKKIHRIERLSGVQMAVVLVNKLPKEYDIEEYAYLIGRRWHVGKNKNGLVYVAAIKQRKQRLEVARLLKAKLDEESCKELLDITKPYFKETNYSGGLKAMVDGLDSKLIVESSSSSQSIGKSQTSTVDQVASNQPKTTSDKVIEVVASIITFLIMSSPLILLIAYIIHRIVKSRRRKIVEQESHNDDDEDDNGPVTHSSRFTPNRQTWSRSSSAGPYSGGRGSNIGSALGGFAAGAATGYAARAIQDHLKEDRERDKLHEEQQQVHTESYQVSDNDNEETDWGNWSDNSSSSDSSSSSDTGFDGDSGATSDW